MRLYSSLDIVLLLALIKTVSPQVSLQDREKDDIMGSMHDLDEILRPIQDESSPTICNDFTYGNWREKEFTSPGWPEIYSNQTECFRVLAAPPGYRIKLDFRDDFKIESSPGCEYDFLEIRDGPFGYSPKLGQYCGDSFPPLIKSRSRYLWLHFQSDESIEYKGFKAVYEFFKPTLQDMINPDFYSLCRIDVDISSHEGFLTDNDISNETLEALNDQRQPVDCTWVINAPNGYRVSLKWDSYQASNMEKCEDSYLEIYEQRTTLPARRKQYCGNTAKPLQSKSNLVFLRTYSRWVTYRVKFELLATLFTTGGCMEDEFSCQDDMCINKKLVCNDRANCKEATDEKSCPKLTTAHAEVSEAQPLVMHYSFIILGVIGGIVVTVIIIAICIACIQHRNEKRRRKQAIKQEKQRNAMEMTKLIHPNRQSPGGTVYPDRRTRVPNRDESPPYMLNHVNPDANSTYPAHTIHGKTPTHRKDNGVNQIPPSQVDPELARGPHKNGAASSLKPSRPNSQGYALPNPDCQTTYRRYADYPSYHDDDDVDAIQPIADASKSPTRVDRTRSKNSGTSNHSKRPDRPKKSELPGSRDKSPSPRPDVVQEERGYFPRLPDTRRRPELQRHHSLETVLNDRTEVWKPFLNKSNSLSRAEAANQIERWNDMNSPTPVEVDYSYPYYDPPESPNKPVVPRGGYVKPKDMSASQRKNLAKSPDLFYTRPNRGTSQNPRGVVQYHPV